MADQSVNVLVASEADGVNPRRNFLGKASSSKSGEKGLPQYLQALSGSCHEFCKYGKQHEFEKKPRQPFPTRPEKKQVGEKDLPHHLQASSGSCHDFCKYGKQYDFEKKPRQPFPRRPKKQVDERYSVEIWEQGKKTPMVKLKPQPKLKTHTLDAPELIEWELSKNLVDRPTPEIVMSKKKSGAMLLIDPAEGQSPLRKITPKKKTPLQQVLTKSTDSQSSVSSGISSEKKKSSIHGTKKASPPKPRISSDLKPLLSSRINKQDTSLSSEKLTVSLKQASLKPKAVNLSVGHAISSKLNLSSDSLDVLTGRKSSDIKMRQRTRTPVIIVKKGQASPRGSFSPKSSGSRVARTLPSKTSLSIVQRGFSTPRASLSSKVSLSRVTRGFSSPRASLPSKISLSRVASLNVKKQGGSKVISPLKNQKKIGEIDAEQPKVKQVGPSQSIRDLKEPNNGIIQEKTLYVIKMETENKYVDSDVNEKVSVESSPPPSSASPRASSLPKSPSLSSHNEQDKEESEYCSTEAEEEPLSDNDETEYVKDADVLESEYQGRHRNGGVVSTEDKDGQPVKLRFRRGKVVDILSESRSPRRLKFRHGRVLGQNQNLKGDGRVNFKKGSNGNTNDHQIDSGKVVLRHQDVQRKDMQGLFNNVIEETAGKLVETRKSKVKALVGAFETVISLQDGKPSANAIS